MNKKLAACCLLFAVLMFSTTVKGDTILTDPSGTSQWAFENFTNVDDPYVKISQTFRLADTDSHFTSFSLDLNAVVDAFWSIYNTKPTTVQVPDSIYLGFAAYLNVNGVSLSDLGYSTQGTFGTSELELHGGGYDKDIFDVTGEAALERHLVVNLADMPETNELTFTWEVCYSSGFDLFPLLEAQAGYTQWDYCGGGYWSADGVFDIAYDSERNANAATPEPATMLIFGLGLTGLAFRRRFAPKA
jgi:hypothetical protein